jgi:hypothetical protein
LRPGAGRQNETIRFDDATVGPDAHAGSRLAPLEHALARTHDRSVRQRSCDVRDDAALRQHEASVRLEDDREVVGQPIGGEAPSDLASVDRLVGQVVLEAGSQRSLVDPPAALDDPGDVQELLARLPLQLAPELVRAAQERHVVGVLEVPEPDDPRDAVGRAELVRDVEALEPEHAPAAPREVVGGRASHPADADDDHVVPLHPGVTLSPAG